MTNSHSSPRSGVGDLPHIIASAFYHPDHRLRSSLRRQLADFVQACRPWHTPDEVRAQLQGVTGSTIEPFVLDPTALEVGVLLTQLAFSDVGNQTRVRVVSQATIGSEGGAILTRGLRSYYAERYVFGCARSIPKSVWFIAPAMMPTDPSGIKWHGYRADASIETTDSGVRIWTSWDGGLPQQLAADRAMFARRLQTHSRIVGRETSLSSLGIRIDVMKNSLELRTGSPESQIRLTALCAQGAVVKLDSGDSDMTLPRAFIKLLFPDERPVALPMVVTSSPAETIRWTVVPVPRRLETPREDRLAISRWLPPHESWMGDLIGDLL
jgi:hypothetical protein